MREDHRKFDGSNHLAFLIFSKRVGFKFPQHKKKEREIDREMEGGREEEGKEGGTEEGNGHYVRLRNSLVIVVISQ